MGCRGWTRGLRLSTSSPSLGMQTGRRTPQPGQVQEPTMPEASLSHRGDPAFRGLLALRPQGPQGLQAPGLRRGHHPPHKDEAAEHTQEPSYPTGSPSQSATPLLR